MHCDSVIGSSQNLNFQNTLGCSGEGVTQKGTLYTLLIMLQFCMFLHIMLCLAYLIVLGVRSLANASRAIQFNPLNPPGVGWVPLLQTNMAAVVGRARSSAVVRGRARSCVRGRSCVVVRGSAW